VRSGEPTRAHDTGYRIGYSPRPADVWCCHGHQAHSQEASSRKNAGGLYQRKDGMWCARSPCRARTASAVARSSRGPRRTTPLAALNKALDDLRKTGDLPTASPTLEAWLNLWFDRIASKRHQGQHPAGVPQQDRQLHRPSDRHVPARAALDRPRPATPRLHHQDLGLSATTALQAHRILAKALTDAEREGRVVRNVAKLVDAPKQGRRQDLQPDNEQHKVMVRAAGERDESEAARWIVAFQSGLRPGERLGLTVDEILFDRHIIRVAWQLQRLTFTHGCGPARRHAATSAPATALNGASTSLATRRSATSRAAST
jgi:integrase